MNELQPIQANEMAAIAKHAQQQAEAAEAERQQQKNTNKFPLRLIHSNN